MGSIRTPYASIIASCGNIIINERSQGQLRILSAFEAEDSSGNPYNQILFYSHASVSALYTKIDNNYHQKPRTNS